MRARAWLAVLFLLVPAVLAQVPPPPQASVEIEAEETGLTVTVEAPRSVGLTVTNTQEATGTPLDQDRTVVVTVSGVPTGWSATVEPTDLRIGPGESADVTLTVTVSTGANDGNTELTVTARLFPLGVNQVPGAGPAADPEATDSVTIQATRDDAFTRDVLEGVGPWIYVIFLAFLVTLLILLRFLLAGRRTTVRLSTETRELSVRAGGDVQFPFRVENLTRKPGNVIFQVSAVEPGWDARLPSPELNLQASESAEILLTVSAPAGAAGGAQQHILVSAIPVLNPKRPANLDFVAVAEKGRRK